MHQSNCVAINLQCKGFQSHLERIKTRWGRKQAKILHNWILQHQFLYAHVGF